ncbi:hypothetical protein PILCRDRAFT_3241 [Piloderma croceum F 1598]|uniref:Uncharacterized protein n=1 Tax=Piloderma croceum (strain F 1598) TaxID=765440 RepID=A0A0C3G8X7_PILCF|nr:hypothetical protein PILCRDRAFT_3241 [Piloderma croceum F 1598]
MASVLATLLVVENLIAYAANRRYHSFSNLDFLEGPERRRTRRNPPVFANKYQRADTDDGDLVPLTSYPAPYGGRYTDPYDSYYHSRKMSE